MNYLSAMIDTIEIANPDQSYLKLKILKAGIKQQENVVKDFKKRVSEIMASEANDANEYDCHQQSFKSETMAEVSLLSDQLQVANHELDQLKRLQSYTNENHTCAEFGTVVKTDKGTFFISAGLEKFYVDDLPVLGLSVYSPLYREMKGKKVGDYFNHNGIIFQIEEIF